VIEISTVGLDGDFLYGLNMNGASEYLLAIQLIVALFVLMFFAWMLYPRIRKIG